MNDLAIELGLDIDDIEYMLDRADDLLSDDIDKKLILVVLQIEMGLDIPVPTKLFNI